ncbi:hypothetical protein RRG08_065301, partial [Elysia crispata]
MPSPGPLPSTSTTVESMMAPSPPPMPSHGPATSPP